MVPVMPALFLGHGNPMHALADDVYTQAWAKLGQQLPQPKAILAISAHWYIPATAVTSSPRPWTIHDFGNFPPELFAVEYPAPGYPELARQIQQLLAPISVKLDEQWGLDHGTWSVLKHVFPQANIPVIQLSLDETQPPQCHYEIGQRLSQLREQGILILGSGNIIHNLRTYAWHHPETPAFDWATRFEAYIQNAIIQGDSEAVINYESFGSDALLAVPTPEHYLPLLYVLGCRQNQEPVSFPVVGSEGGSVSMLSVQIG